jgi:hypothetical protein
MGRGAREASIDGFLGPGIVAPAAAACVRADTIDNGRGAAARPAISCGVGYSLYYVRFPATWLPALERDRDAAERVALHGGAAGELDLGRGEDDLYTLLRPSAPRQMLSVTRPDDPLAHALVGRRWLVRVGDPIDTGYGTPHLVPPADVLEIAALLAALDEATLRDRAARLGLADYIVARALALREFYGAAAAEAQAVVVTPC